MWGAGCDCTDDFEEIGHSSLAKSLIGDYLIWNSDTNTNSKTATNTSNNNTTIATSNITTTTTTSSSSIIASTSTTSHANSMISNLAIYERTKRNRKNRKITKYQRQILNEKKIGLRKAYQHIRFKYDDNDVYIGDDFNNDDCIRLQVHSSQPKMFYCSLNQTHYCWYSCCGYSKRIVI